VGLRVKQSRAHQKLLRSSDDGHVFDSVQERCRYEYLRLDPDITWLEVKPSFDVVLKGFIFAKYSFDFSYIKGGYTFYEEFKGHWVASDIMRFKLLLLAAQPARVIVCMPVKNSYKETEVEVKQQKNGIRVIDVSTGGRYDFGRTAKNQKARQANKARRT